MTNRCDLMAVGLTTLDVTVYPVDAFPEPDGGQLVERICLAPAGTAAGTAYVAAKLGLSATIVSAVGSDPQGRIVRSMLEEGGVDTAMLETSDAMPTSTTVLPVRSDGARPIFHMIGASVMADIPAGAWAAANQAKGVHWGAVGFPGVKDSGADFLRAARTAGAFITCDLIVPSEESMQDLARLLPFVDLFMPSLSEISYLAGTEDPNEAAAFFMNLGAGGCVFKMGAQGALLITREQKIAVPGFNIVPVDTTSCGDSFCAGFHAARGRDLPLEDCLRFASATAAQVAQAVGTTGALQGFDTTWDFARTAPLRQGIAA